jgi:hypothetical protein
MANRPEKKLNKGALKYFTVSRANASLDPKLRENLKKYLVKDMKEHKLNMRSR